MAFPVSYSLGPDLTWVLHLGQLFCKIPPDRRQDLLSTLFALPLGLLASLHEWAMVSTHSKKSHQAPRKSFSRDRWGGQALSRWCGEEGEASACGTPLHKCPPAWSTCVGPFSPALSHPPLTVGSWLSEKQCSHFLCQYSHSSALKSFLLVTLCCILKLSRRWETRQDRETIIGQRWLREQDD